MPLKTDEIQKALRPIRDYEDLCRRWRTSFSYPFVCEHFNLTMPALAAYTALLLGGDSRGRYYEYAARLIETVNGLYCAGVQDVLDLTEQTGSPEGLTLLGDRCGLDPLAILAMLKYLVYWVIPMDKPLGSLVRDDPLFFEATRALREVGIRSNLDLLQQGLTAARRRSLAKRCRLPERVILELVNRADLSRLPWASKATISNIMGAGYGSLARLAGADPGQLSADFYNYGERIGKNLKLGNEIENSYRIAKIVPALLKNEPHTGRTPGSANNGSKKSPGRALRT